MIARRISVGVGVGVLVATAALVAPAFGASEQPARQARHLAPLARGIGAFTPAAADPRLAAVFARGGLDASTFRFTPAETRRDNRAVTVAVRARSTLATPATRVATLAPTVGIAPIAYNLGMSVGWKKFAVTGDVNHVDLGALPGSRESADLALSYTAKRFTGQVKAVSDRPMAGTSKLVEEMPSYSVDVGGAYALTHNLDLTAGVRYRSDQERLARINDDRRESQAVYVGTAFRF